MGEKEKEVSRLGVHRIITEGGPVAFPNRRYSAKVENNIEKTVNDWLKQGVIREPLSPWRSPLVVVPKKEKE